MRWAMRLLTVLGVVAMTVAIGCCVLLGTVGWFVVGFGTMTDCTNAYSCSTQSCAPCAVTGLWINAGGLAQWLLAAVGVGVLVRGVRGARPSILLIGGAALLVASAATIVSTTWRAGDSYCQPGTAGYSQSYCSTG
jgi:hypothetical protein